MPGSDPSRSAGPWALQEHLQVKLGFLNGAALSDPEGLFNGELAGNQRRAIEFSEGDRLEEGALKTLVRAAISYNQAKRKK